MLHSTNLQRTWAQQFCRRGNVSPTLLANVYLAGHFFYSLSPAVFSNELTYSLNVTITELDDAGPAIRLPPVIPLGITTTPGFSIHIRKSAAAHFKRHALRVYLLPGKAFKCTVLHLANGQPAAQGVVKIPFADDLLSAGIVPDSTPGLVFQIFQNLPSLHRGLHPRGNRCFR